MEQKIVMLQKKYDRLNKRWNTELDLGYKRQLKTDLIKIENRIHDIKDRCRSSTIERMEIIEE